MQIFSSIFDQLFSSRVLGIGLWVGLAVITVLLLVLMRTRWGHAKPLKKCVALSVFAHVLLMGYAYGTKLIFDYPPLVADQAVPLTILADDHEDESPADTDDVKKPKPWEQFTTQAPVQPSTINPGRQTVDHTQQINPHFQQDAPQFDAVSPPVGSKMTEPNRPVAKASTPDVPRPKQAVEQVASIERPNVEKSEAPPEPKKPFGPNISELPRLPGTNSTSGETRTRRPNEADVATEPKLPRLSEIPFLAPSADALKAVRDAALRDLLRNNSIQQENRIDPASEGNAQTQSGQTPRRLGDGQPLPGAYRLRFSGERLRIAKQSGGNEQTEAAVKLALKWLASQQQRDGRWDADALGAGLETKVLGHDRQGAGVNADTGVTGLALLAFLGAGHTHFEGGYAEQIRRGLEFLLLSQAGDGNLAGDARFFAQMYCHGMAMLAISEAYAITGDHRLKPYVQRAVNYSVASQIPTSGGWRYQPGDDLGDMSQFGWQVMALKSAEMAGITIPDTTQAKMLKFLQSTSSGSHGGLASYRAGDVPSRTMTAEALVCRVFLKQADRATIDEAATFIDQRRPTSGVPNLYYWYYATLGLRQINDRRWQRWNDALKTQLLGRQRKDGRLAGSWDHNTVWGSYGGRIYSTALATMCLESYYRYLPLFGE